MYTTQIIEQSRTITHYALSRMTDDGIVWYDWCYGIWSRYPVQMHTLDSNAAHTIRTAHTDSTMVTVETVGHVSNLL
jgi:hypothetical protein